MSMALVLVAEDNSDTREVLCVFLQSIGHTVRCAANGRDAIQAVLEQVPDVIVSDLTMPEMNGAGLLDMLRSYLRLQHVPVIVWTGADPESEAVRQVRKLDMSAILIKPGATLDDLKGAIERAMSKT
jgi:CheY-like chemotaxis protein